MRLLLRIIPVALLAVCEVLWAAPQERAVLEAYGLSYELRELHETRTNRVHILRVDLALGKVEPKVVLAEDPDGEGPAEAALTDPRRLAKGASVLAFINASPWDSFPNEEGKRDRDWHGGQPVDIHGLAVSEGHLRSHDEPKNVSVWFEPRGGVHLGGRVVEESVTEGLAGFEQIVKDGVLVARASEKTAPRTSLGAEKNGKLIWLVVVDGRQPGFSEGMTYRELGEFMLGLGCWNAVNLDGGGSSIMGLVDGEGRLRVMNRPSDRSLGLFPKIRPLPVVLTIRKISEAEPRSSVTVKGGTPR